MERSKRKCRLCWGVFPFLLSLLACFSTLLVSPKVSATTFGENISFRSYYSSSTGVTNQTWNSVVTSYPKVLLGFASNETRYLYGFTLDWGIGDTTGNMTKTVTAVVTMVQDVSDGNTFENPRSIIQLNTSKGNVEGQCSFLNPVSSNTPHRASWTCIASVGDNATISNAQILIGKVRTAQLGDDPIATICGLSPNDTCNGAVSLVDFSYDISYSNDPNTSLLETQIQQNETIINQNETIINQNQQTQDYITDDTPPEIDLESGLDTAGWLPAGPVDSILTIPITFLQGILDVLGGSKNCQPVSLPLPYINSTLSLPCMKSIFDEIGITPLWNIVGGIISMFVIWDTLKWLYKFVDDTLTFREDNSNIWGGL